jgi:hypothetical protein
MGSICTAVLIGLDPATPPPAFGLMYEGDIGQPRWTTSLCDPLVRPFCSPMRQTWLPCNFVISISIGSSTAPHRDSANLILRMNRGAEDLLLLTQGFQSLFQKENPGGLQLSIGCPYTMVFCIYRTRKGFTKWQCLIKIYCTQY